MPVLDVEIALPAMGLPDAGEIVVFDLEWTAWDGSHARGWSEPWEWREIIQIGAVRVDTGAVFREVDAMELLVQPNRNPILSQYTQDLTGIGNDRMKREGVEYRQALKTFSTFCAGAICIYSNGVDTAVLRENCLFNSLQIPPEMPISANLRPLLARLLGREEADLVSSSLPNLLGLPSEPSSHTGLADSRAIVRTLAEIRRQGRV